jgi:archaellum component FlaC
MLREKYNLRSIDAINVVKRGLSVVKRLKLNLPIQDFYSLIDTVVGLCVKGGRVDLNEFEKLLERYIGRHRVGEVELASLAEERHRIEKLLQDVKEELVDFALRIGDIEGFEKWFKTWYDEVSSEIRLWGNITKKAKSIDFGELIRSIRLSREV